MRRELLTIFTDEVRFKFEDEKINKATTKQSSKSNRNSPFLKPHLQKEHPEYLHF